ncbi:EAL domain-containing protein [Dyella sp. EPa41]|uniref:putative bifunctional diguanylate cyclase/phosphodiesterase n=1 Tax=Dyella sp. EPa41 TaxID=1561194 RepID=UPI0019151EAC|nr:EAL domain-containing protein [Dyella sp. EPa41]
MRAPGFRMRLTLFVVTTIVAIQLVTAVLVTQITRHQLVAEGERQLAVSADAFVSQLDDVSARVAESVQILALDYALRAAIAQHDQDTVLSVLRNHGRRVDATRMLMVGLDGSIQADTAGTATLQRFPFPDMLDRAFSQRTAAVVALDGKAYWMVVVPIYAPQPVALVAAGIPMDDAFLARMLRHSTLPTDIQLIAPSGASHWQTLARSNTRADLLDGLAGQPLGGEPVLERVDGREYLVLSRPLSLQPHGTPVQALIAYSLDDALRPYRSVLSTWFVLLALGLLVGLMGAWLIARGISRPVEALAASVRRIERGDYSLPPRVDRSDELGQLADAFTTMTQAIRQREERIRFQALHDAVTELPNRNAAEAAIQQDLQEQTGGALLMVGLTRMPEIIKTVGHALGDRLMRDAALRIGAATTGLVARASDTAFLVWLPGADRGDVVAQALHLLEVLNKPYQEPDISVDATPAVGIAEFPFHAHTASALLQRAEVALLAALRTPEAVAFYDAGNDPHSPERLSLMGDLRAAISRNEVTLHYQPKLNLRHGIVESGEALLRWRHPRLGPVAPDSFITLAEETGNIHRVTRWALANAVAQLQRWSAEGVHVQVAVNLSARDLHDQDLPRRIGDLLALHRVQPRWLRLEVTESAVIGEPAVAIQVLSELSDLGVCIAIDDFGVGESSLAYLRRLPVHELKIDKMFVQRLGTEIEDRLIVRSIIELAHRLGYSVTAEGVEDEVALAYLVEAGCDYAQGHYIAAAMPADRFASFVAEYTVGSHS